MRHLRLSVALFLAFAAPSSALAHGINGHVWVTDGALNALHDCDLRAWITGPDYRPVAQIASAFPDSGYAVNHAYGEAAHWEPFVQSYIKHLRAKYHDDYGSPEARQSVAFLFGAAAHGMEDEVFDSMLLRETEEIDHVGQDWTDPGTDFMLVADGLTDLKPAIFVADADVIPALKGVGVDVTPAEMDRGMNLVRVVVIGMAGSNNTVLDDEYRPALTWTSEHYLDFKTPGSFPYEMSVVGPYFDVLWHRLHGDFRLEDVVIQTVPAPGLRLASNDPASVFSYPALVFGYGMRMSTLTQDTVQLHDAAGKRIPVQILNTRWNASEPRVIQLKPQQPFAPDAEYVMSLRPGAEAIDGTKVSKPLQFRFRSACAKGAVCDAIVSPVTAATCAVPAKPHATTSSGCAAGGLAIPLGLAMPLLWRRRRPRSN